MEYKSHRKTHRCLPLIGCVSAACLLAGTANAQDFPPPPDAHDHSGWAALAAGGTTVDGNEATFQQRHQTPAHIWGGLESFYWETFTEDDLFIQVEGEALVGRGDYKIIFGIENEEEGYLQVGFSQFRTYFDGSEGGYHSPSDTYLGNEDDDLHLDRGSIWFEGGIKPEDLPTLNFRYTRLYRQGEKDSTFWGRDNALSRGIQPAHYDINETRDIFEVWSEYTIKNTDLGLRLRYEIRDQDNESFSGYERTENIRAGIFNTLAWTRTEVNDKLNIAMAYSFTNGDSETTADRFERDGTPYWINLDADAQYTRHVFNINALYKASPDLLIIPSFRAEARRSDIHSYYNQVGGFGPGGPAFIDADYETVAFDERLEIRYFGIDNWRFTLRGDWGQQIKDAYLFEPGETQDVEYERFNQAYTAAAAWNINPNMNLAAQYVFDLRELDNDFAIRGTTSQDFENLDLTAHKFNVRLTTRPVNRVTLVTRYDLLLAETESKIHNNVLGVTYPTIESGDRERHMFSQSVTWVPVDSLYLQLTGHYVSDRLETPAQDPAGNPGLVQETENDYWSFTAAAGYAFSEKTNVDLTYNYLSVDNYDDTGATTVAYGIGEYEHTVLLNLTHQIKKDVTLKGGYSYSFYREDNTAGNRDYDAHGVYAAVAFTF